MPTPHATTATTFETRDPATGEVIATFPVHDEGEVRAAVVRARAAAGFWRDLGHGGRRERLQAFKARIARGADELCALIHRENGKPLADAFIEVLLAVDHLDWAARNARRTTRLRRMRTTPLLLNQSAYLEYVPAGVVGVIGPWNYPLHTPLGSVTYALAAGNAVVFKPSEHTPAVAEWVVRAFAEVVPEQPVLQLVTGFGETGAALCRAGVDVLAFTGSSTTGRKVMAACAETLTKVVLECGGKDALIVDRDADVRAAAAAALWGACSNAGQTCAGVERVYVHEAVYEPFLAQVVHQAGQVRVGRGPDADLGPITVPAQVEVIRAHIEDALERGARAVVGGPESVRPPYVAPVVLVDVPPDARVLREETFGPVLPVVAVRDLDEAVRLANDNDFALGAAVFSAERGMEVARRLDSGMVSVNSVLAFAGVPSLPFGGRRESGFGRIHGEDGLKEFAVARAVTRQRVGLPFELTSFTRPPQLVPLLARVLRLRHGRG